MVDLQSSQGNPKPERGHPKVSWVVRHIENGNVVLHMSYDRHTTPEEAIQAFEQHTGKPWVEHVREGATIVQKEVMEFPPLGNQG